MSIGDLTFDFPPTLRLRWSIPDFFRLATGSRWSLQSPGFSFADGRYGLRLFHTVYLNLLCDWIAIELLSLTDPDHGSALLYEVQFKTGTAEEDMFRQVGENTVEIRFPRWVLQVERDRYVPDGTFTLLCSVRQREQSVGGTPNSEQTSNEEGDEEGLRGVEKVLSDYKRLLLKGVESDACLVVCGKEFRAHRNVLRARSPVFEAMFGHETAEKDSGRVVIDDLKPDRFQDFMEYLYTGRVESFCDENAFGLYAAADKYDVPALKSECVEYMRRSLSVDNFCDVLTLALRHHEKDLLALAVEFFKKNVAGIILTVKWQQFMSENSTRANELFIKLHVPGKEAENVLLP